MSPRPRPIVIHNTDGTYSVGDETMLPFHLRGDWTTSTPPLEWSRDGANGDRPTCE